LARQSKEKCSIPIVIWVQNLQGQCLICSLQLRIGLFIDKSVSEFFDNLRIISKVVEKTNSIENKVHLLQSTCLSDNILVLSEHVDVMPKKDVHPTQRVIKATRLFDTQESLLIVVNLSLIEILVDHFDLFTV
jgi:hypothetical protein